MSAEQNAVVLLSGGLDSSGAAMWAARCYARVRAVAFGYGQAHRDAELAASQRIAAELRIPWTRLELADALLGGVAAGVPRMGTGANGVSLANVPARNFVFLALAAAHAGHHFAHEPIDLVIGSHRDDVATFPDCRPDFCDAAGTAAALALRGVCGPVRVVAPWAFLGKAEIVRTFADDPDALGLLRSTVSCYAGTRCNRCDACAQRAAAWADAGLDDGDGRPIPMTGGDPAREPRR